MLPSEVLLVVKKRHADGWEVELIHFLESLAGYCLIANRINLEGLLV